MNRNPKAITDLQRRQLTYGFASDGEVLGLYRSTGYSLYKSRISQAGFGVVDLKVTGDYYRSFVAKAAMGNLNIYNTDRKAYKLAEKYDKDRIMGLNEDSRNEYRFQTLKPNINAAIRKKILNG